MTVVVVAGALAVRDADQEEVEAVLAAHGLPIADDASANAAALAHVLA